MKSLKELYRIGRGPSSSHTMGPSFVAAEFLAATKGLGAVRYEVELRDSLAATGRGHFTDRAVKDVLGAKRTKIVWKPDFGDKFHPNGMRLAAFDARGAKVAERVAYSIGGGAIAEKGGEVHDRPVYRQRSMSEIVNAATRAGIPLWQIVEDAEGPGIWDFLKCVYSTMMSAIDRGLAADGVLPGGLRLPRKARAIYIKAKMQSESMRRTGLVGNVVKRNGSISGAEVGCQGEVGVACAMASAAAAYLMGGSPRQCECAAEIGLEHFLGLTCDPVKGLVQIPCIERNALAATRSVVAGEMSVLSDGAHVVSFDTVVKTMLETGHDLPRLYRETSVGGLSRFVRR